MSSAIMKIFLSTLFAGVNYNAVQSYNGCGYHQLSNGGLQDVEGMMICIQSN